MREIDQFYLDELKKHQYIPTILLKLELRYEDLPTPEGSNFIPEDLYYTSWPAKLGGLYEPLGMDFRSINYGSSSIVDNVSLELNDVEYELYDKFDQLDINEDQKITITAATLNQTTKDLENNTIIWVGYLSGWTYNQGILKVKAVSVFDNWRSKTTNKFTNSCRWKKFKGEECGYVGGKKTCDRSYDTCKSYNNKENFGGFRWIANAKAKPGYGGNDKKE